MDNWMNNPMLQNMDPAKLQMLSSLASEGVNKNKNEMLPFFLSAMNNAGKQGLDFNADERTLLMQVLMQNLSPEEKKKAETILQMTSAFQKKS